MMRQTAEAMKLRVFSSGDNIKDEDMERKRSKPFWKWFVIDQWAQQATYGYPATFIMILDGSYTPKLVSSGRMIGGRSIKSKSLYGYCQIKQQ